MRYFDIVRVLKSNFGAVDVTELIISSRPTHLFDNFKKYLIS